MQAETQIRQKITPYILADICRMVKDNLSTGEIVRLVSERHNVNITQSRISQIRKTILRTVIKHSTKDLEGLVARKIVINDCMLEIITNMYKMIRECVNSMGHIDNAKEMNELVKSVTLMHKLYNEFNVIKDEESAMDMNINKELGE